MSDAVIIALIGLVSANLGVVLKMVHDTRTYRADREAREDETTKIIKRADQALLRHELKEAYKEALKEGGATLEDRDEWSNMYDIYHALGANGAMDDIREKYFELPIRG